MCVLRTHKIVLWEQAKGQLRALAGAEANMSLLDLNLQGLEPHQMWEDLHKKVEDFILEIEENGLQE